MSVIGLWAGCGDDGDDGGLDPVETYAVSGEIVDFETGSALTGASVTASGLSPSPTVTVDGSMFTMEGVPRFSVFNLLTSSPPDYRATYNSATEVEDADLTGLTALVVSEAFITQAATAFGVTPTAGRAVLLVRAVDEVGAPASGVPGTAYRVGGDMPTSGPFFLDSALAPDALLTETSDSGWAMFFDIEPGLVAIDAAVGSGYTMVMPLSPSAATTITIADIAVTGEEADPLPTNVSFSADVVPIFDKRGCGPCHSGNGVGRDLGGVTLDASANLIHREVTEEISPNYQTPRVDLADPENSVLLTLPSPEDPPDNHPNVTFASPLDPDYRTILGWIVEGAPNN